MELTIEQALQQGVAAHKEGKLQDAERLYRAILQSQPAHPDANHNLGVLAVSVNKADAALPLFKTALEANPKIEQFWLSYIDALIKEQHFENAKKVLEKGKKQGVAGEKLNVPKKLSHVGKSIKKIWNDAAKLNNLDIEISGIDPLASFKIKSKNWPALLTYFIQEMLKYNILASDRCYANYAHDKKSLNIYKKACEKVFKNIADLEK